MKQHDVDKKIASAVMTARNQAILEERERCAEIADTYSAEALRTGMIAPAAVGKILAQTIRGRLN